jgi:hypothetical protein
MKYGVALPYVDPALTARYAKRAEECGWDGVFVGDAIWTMDPIVGLAAAAVQTSRIRLGTMVIPVPLRKPWKIASEAVALDYLSNGRLILGLGAGAIWMGWQAFPGEPTAAKTRAEMLDETIDILDRMFKREQVDFDGKHFPLKMTLMDLQHYPPKPVQQPRIPLWVCGIWPRKKSMQRILRCDGLLAQKMDPEGKFVDVMPEDVRQMREYVEVGRTLETPFDIIIEEQSGEWEAARIVEKCEAWQAAGATWWIEGLWGADEAGVYKRLEQGTPGVVS